MRNSPQPKRQPKKLFFDELPQQRHSNSARWINHKTESSLNDSLQVNSPEFKWSECLDISSPTPSYKQTLSRQALSPDPMQEERINIKEKFLKPYKIILSQKEPKSGIFDQTFSFLNLNELSILSKSNSKESQFSKLEQFDPSPQIPILKNWDRDQIQMINPETLNDRRNLEKSSKNQKEKLIIIDCRYSYEYQGGHIQGALNIQDPNEMESKLFNNPSSKDQQIIVFYCEFSKKRSPEIYQHIRNCDRKLNASNFPNLCYPDIYVLDLGFQNYFTYHNELCNGGYINMKMLEFKSQYKTEKQQLRGWWQDIKKKNNVRRSNQDLPFQSQLFQ